RGGGRLAGRRPWQQLTERVNRAPARAGEVRAVTDERKDLMRAVSARPPYSPVRAQSPIPPQAPIPAGTLISHLSHLATAPVRLSPPPLRTADGHHRDERRASWLQLFFDLVFPAAGRQLAGALQDHPGLGTLARFVMLFTPIWWLWVQFTFYADRHESEDAVHRAAFFSAILLCVGLAASAPRALAGATTGFAVAFACLRGLQLLLYARARCSLPETRRLYNRYLIFFGAGRAPWPSSPAARRPV